MHLVWMGVARDLAATGADSLAWALDEAERGEVFAFAISEAGNDRTMSDSLTRVDRVANHDCTAGWTFTGTRIFTTLSPAWTRLGVLGRPRCSTPRASAMPSAAMGRRPAWT